MKGFYRTLFAVVAVGAMLLSGTAITALPDASVPEQEGVGNAVSLSDEFQAVLQNESYILYYHSTTNEIALQNRENGGVLFSNPQDRADDTVADAEKKNNLNSQLILYYYKDQVLSEMNSYYYATALGQSTAETQGDEFHVIYQLGQQRFTIDQLPQVVSRDRMEKEILPKLNEEEREILLKRYVLYSRDDLPKEAFDAVKNSFPVIEDHDIYIRAQMPDYEGKKIWEILDKTGYTFEDLQRDCEENRVENTYTEQASFRVELIYTLNDDGLSVTCDPTKIEYTGDFKPVRIEILPFFGAAGTTETGYMLVPDGSGAVIHYNNGKKYANEYWRSLFGDDSAISQSEAPAEREEVLLPVFAACGQNGGFLATVDRGYENAGIAAEVSGKTNSYNNVRAFFDIYAADVLSIGESSANNTFLTTVDECFSELFTISYHPVFDFVSYDAFASMYRDCLLESGQLKQIGAGDTALNLELIGTVGVTKRFLGFPYQSLQSVTSFEQALDIVGQLGIENIDIKYTAALTGGLQQSSASAVKPVGSLGGKKALERLKNTVNRVYFSYYATLQKKASKSQTARTLGNQLVKRNEYNLISRQLEKTKYMVQLSTRTLTKNAEKILKTAQKNKVEAINLLDVGYELNSDFNKSNTIDTYEARVSIQEYLETLSGKLTVSVERGGLYALRYADKLWNIPTTDSGYSIFDENVPFYALVVRGSIPMVTSPVNTAADSTAQFLKTVEIGAQLQYSWLYEYAENVIDSNENYYDRDYSSTIGEAAAYAARIEALYDAVGDAKITVHTRLSEDLVGVTYDNGVTVLVNYDTEAAFYNGTQIPAQDFAICR